ncbi:hypothetical protein C8R43DRAFT_1129251 [Mycena crocata]|nr:hypothetical protein C8R43DRAFT_1129251 [Mycena crocata]
MPRAYSLVLLRARGRILNSVKRSVEHLKGANNQGANCEDLLWTSLTALRTSADAFPPLKGVVGAVTSIMEISQRVTHSRRDAQQLAHRTVQTLELLADVISDAISDPSTIPEPMLASIARFQGTLDEIAAAMAFLVAHGPMWRLRHLNRTEGELKDFNRRLDDASRKFIMVSTLRIEAGVHRVEAHILDTSASSAVLHNTELTLLRRIIFLQAVFFCPSPVLAV